jgi:peptidyl-prolyl cis-trans isomerase A (cyclophilin A)
MQNPRPMRNAIAVLLAGALLGGCFLRAGKPLLEPKQGDLFAAAPDSFVVGMTTSRGRVAIMAHRAWAPAGVDRFYYLAKNGYYDGTRFFRVIRGFVAQFGINGDPAIAAAWRTRRIPDDRVVASNTRGTISFASSGPNTRTVQLFINLADNKRLDTLRRTGFAPIARVIDGMNVVDSLYAGYGEGAPSGRGPSQDSISTQGNAYLMRAFPDLDYIVSARVEREWR